MPAPARKSALFVLPFLALPITPQCSAMVPRLTTPRLCHDVACAVRRVGVSQSYATFRRIPGLGRQEPPAAEAESIPADQHVSGRQRPVNVIRPDSSPYRRPIDSLHGSEHIKQKQYQYWLTKAIPRPPFEPCQWLRSLDAEPGNLPEEFADNPLAVLDDPNANPDLVKRCLEAFIVCTRRDLDTKTEVRKHYKAVKVGASIMKITWGTTLSDA